MPFWLSSVSRSKEINHTSKRHPVCTRVTSHMNSEKQFSNTADTGRILFRVPKVKARRMHIHEVLKITESVCSTQPRVLFGSFHIAATSLGCLQMCAYVCVCVCVTECVRMTRELMHNTTTTTNANTHSHNGCESPAVVFAVSVISLTECRQLIGTQS